MRNYLLFFLCCIPMLVFSQEITNDSIPLKSSKSDTKNNSYINFGVTPTLFLISPRWNIGYIQNINDKLKIGVTAGIGVNNFIFNTYDSSFNDYFLWEIRPEIYFIHNPKKRVTMYNSLELFYINEEDVIVDSYYITKRQNAIYFDKADYHREKLGAVFNFGVFLPFSNKFGINVYAGLGIKWRTNTYSNIVNPVFDYNYDNQFWYSYYRREGLKFGFQPNFGIKLNYIL